MTPDSDSDGNAVVDACGGVVDGVCGRVPTDAPPGPPEPRRSPYIERDE